MSAGSTASHASRPEACLLIERARCGDAEKLGALLENYRNYLSVLAMTQIDRRLLPRVSPSDVVQETVLRACNKFAQFRGGTEAELLAWLRQILVNNLANFIEKHMRGGPPRYSTRGFDRSPWPVT